MTQISRRTLLNASVAGTSSLAGASALAWAGIAGAQENGQAATPRPQLIPLLTFAANAEAAINFYVALFADSKIVSIDRYGPGESGREGSVRIAEFELCAQPVACIDSPVQHQWTFTPAISLYVRDPDEAAIQKYFDALAKQGQVFMPLDEYPFSKKFGWVQDKFGVSWQLSVA